MPGDTKSFYIGLKRSVDSSFFWVKINRSLGADDFTNWYFGNPKNNTQENCVTIGHLSDDLRADFKWRTVNCNKAALYICERSVSDQGIR